MAAYVFHFIIFSSVIHCVWRATRWMMKGTHYLPLAFLEILFWVYTYVSHKQFINIFSVEVKVMSNKVHLACIHSVKNEVDNMCKSFVLHLFCLSNKYKYFSLIGKKYRYLLTSVWYFLILAQLESKFVSFLEDAHYYFTRIE